jgi:hypothetical protein
MDRGAFFNELVKMAVKTTTLQDVVTGYAKGATPEQRTKLHTFGVNSLAKKIPNGTPGDRAIKTLRRRSLGTTAINLSGVKKTAAIGDLGSQSARSKLHKPEQSTLRRTMSDFATAPTQHMPPAKLPSMRLPAPGVSSLAPGHLPPASKKLTSLAQTVTRKGI